MPSVLDLFGELGLRTDAFDRTLRGSVDKMKGAEIELDKVISKSNKLGDTSATVARRYEKLNEGIAIQKQRLLETASAYERGDINAQKYAQRVDAVSRSVDGLISRIKDAKARATELDETGLTHFQNQIQGTVTNQSTSLFGRLSPFQKQQLGFQINDIISGILSGQSLTQIAAQQGGQIVQIFQQGKLAAAETAVATNAAAAAETKFAASAQAAAVAQGEVAIASKATATATTEASGAMTVLGASVVALGAELALGVVAILAAKKATEDVLKASQDRLKAEEAIAGALNKQYLAASALKAELANITYNSQFSQYLQSAGTGPSGISFLQNAQTNLQAQYDANLKSVTAEINRRAAEADRIGLTGANKAKYTDEAVPSGFDEAQKALSEQITGIASKIAELKSALPSTVDIYQKQLDGAVRAQQAADEQRNKAQKEAADAAKEFARKLEAARDATDRYVKDLESKVVGSIGRSLTDYKLSREAQEFRQGFKFGPQAASETLQQQLAAIPGLRSTIISEIVGTVSGGALPTSNITRDYQEFQIPKNLDPQQKRAIEEAIIQATAGVDPASLTIGQRNLAAFARDDIVKQDREALLETLKNLNDAINNGTIVTFKDESNSVKSIVSRATPAATASRYSDQ